MNLRLFWHRVRHWEFWPFWMIYYPLFPLWFFFSIRARSFFFFNATNPSIENGGMAMESKNDIYKLLPKAHIPTTFLVKKGANFDMVKKRMMTEQISYPCIAKPDIGMKAFGVEKINSESELLHYVTKSPKDFLIQDFIPYQKEVGIFYVRLPIESKGRITGIVGKEFLTVTGDGKSTVLQLIKKDARSHFQLSKLQKRMQALELNRILNEGEEKILVPFGSHTRGAKFIDLSSQINEQLTNTFDKIASQIGEFYYGRFDVLYDNFETLSEGKQFKIVEVNGAGSEPTHIYDPKHSLFFAWKEIYKHWNYMNKIGILNHKRGHRYLSFKEGRYMLKANDLLEKELKLV